MTLTRLALVLVAFIVLAGCDQAGNPTATLAPYTGARINGDPTPGNFMISSNDTNELYLKVDGEVATVLELYAAAWRADGWQELGRRQEGDSTLLSLQRGEKTRLLVFRRYDTLVGKTTFVIIEP